VAGGWPKRATQGRQREAGAASRSATRGRAYLGRGVLVIALTALVGICLPFASEDQLILASAVGDGPAHIQLSQGGNQPLAPRPATPAQPRTPPSSPKSPTHRRRQDTRLQVLRDRAAVLARRALSLAARSKYLEIPASTSPTSQEVERVTPNMKTDPPMRSPDEGVIKNPPAPPSPEEKIADDSTTLSTIESPKKPSPTQTEGDENPPPGDPLESVSRTASSGTSSH
jgi:hypothetical protein